MIKTLAIDIIKCFLIISGLPAIVILCYGVFSLFAFCGLPEFVNWMASAGLFFMMFIAYSFIASKTMRYIAEKYGY